MIKLLHEAVDIAIYFNRLVKEPTEKDIALYTRLTQLTAEMRDKTGVEALELAEEAWRMLPDSCKEIMGETLKTSFTESLTEDIKHAFLYEGPREGSS